MSCCAHCEAIDAAFDERVAERDLERHRREGPHRSTRELLDAIREAGGAAGANVLDVGGGIGAVAVVNLTRRIRGTAFRAYVFRKAAVNEAVRRAGLTPRSRRRGLVWGVALYERTAASS